MRVLQLADLVSQGFFYMSFRGLTRYEGTAT